MSILSYLVNRLRRPSLQNPTMEGVTGSMAAGMTVGAGVGPEASPEAEAEHEAAAEVGHQQGLLDGKGNTHHKRKVQHFPIDIQFNLQGMVILGHELFIGQLPYSCEEHEVKKFFKKHGFKPLEVRMPRDKITQQPRGFAFVLFGTAREVEEATELNGTNMGGRQLRINHANEKPIPGRGGRPERFGGRGYGGRSDRGRAASSPSKTLFIRNLSYDTTEDTLLKLFRSAHNVSLPTTGDGSLKGFGFIDFDDEEEAEYALRKMDGKRVNGREIRLEYKRGGGGDRERSSYSYDSRRGRDYDRDRSREYDRDRDRGGNRYY
jgi:RNA recognition motif-containing protein